VLGKGSVEGYEGLGLFASGYILVQDYSLDTKVVLGYSRSMAFGFTWRKV